VARLHLLDVDGVDVLANELLDSRLPEQPTGVRATA
jgi:hypothetical protein